MIGMGRTKSVHKDLPPRMVARVLASGKRLFYYQRNGKKIPLGQDINAARMKWAELEHSGTGTGERFVTVSRQYEIKVVPGLRLSTQREYIRALKNLEIAFSAFTLEQIRPADVKAYMDKRSKKISAIREKSVLSAVFKWAREKGFTSVPNPCDGVGFSQQEKAKFQYTGKRDRYVTEAEFQDVLSRATPVLADVMELCLLTSQRLGDVLRWTRHNIVNGRLEFRQGKTGKAMKMRIEGQLKAVIERIQARPRAVQTMQLVADAKGQRLTQAQVYYAFRQAKGTADWQIRDLRAKAVTDEPDLKVAQGRAGHASELTTAGIYRRIKGEDVGPLR